MIYTQQTTKYSYSNFEVRIEFIRKIHIHIEIVFNPFSSLIILFNKKFEKCPYICRKTISPWVIFIMYRVSIASIIVKPRPNHTDGLFEIGSNSSKPQAYVRYAFQACRIASRTAIWRSFVGTKRDALHFVERQRKQIFILTCENFSFDSLVLLNTSTEIFNKVMMRIEPTLIFASYSWHRDEQTLENEIKSRFSQVQ